LKLRWGAKHTFVNILRLLKKGGKARYENDISAESQATEKGTRIQKTDEHEERSQCPEEETDERAEETYSIGPCARSFYFIAGGEYAET
jgi:hypothetical protein